MITYALAALALFGLGYVVYRVTVIIIAAFAFIKFLERNWNRKGITPYRAKNARTSI